MSCKRIGDAIVCEANTVEYGGFLIEFPPIGCPAMLNKDTFEVISYQDTPDEFWEAVALYNKPKP